MEWLPCIAPVHRVDSQIAHKFLLQSWLFTPTVVDAIESSTTARRRKQIFHFISSK